VTSRRAGVGSRAQRIRLRGLPRGQQPMRPREPLRAACAMSGPFRTGAWPGRPTAWGHPPGIGRLRLGIGAGDFDRCERRW